MRYLAAREHSRVELERKLAPHAESAVALAAVLDQLESAGWLSLERFAQSVAFRRSAQCGVRRIAHELQTHRVDAAQAQAVLEPLRQSEHARAQALWQRRFTQPPSQTQEYARQYRFLAQRGFASSVIHAILRTPADLAFEPCDDEL